MLPDHCKCKTCENKSCCDECPTCDACMAQTGCATSEGEIE